VIVVDASVFIKWVVPERGTVEALKLRAERIAAPTLWLAECANVLWRHVRLNELTETEAADRLSQLRAADVEHIAIEELLSEAFLFANQLRHPIYDCLYLSAAVRNNTRVVTADRRFASAVSRHSGLAKHIEILVGA